MSKCYTNYNGKYMGSEYNTTYVAVSPEHNDISKLLLNAGQCPINLKEMVGGDSTTIKARFTLGDNVWCMVNNKIVERTIVSICIYHGYDGYASDNNGILTNITYRLLGNIYINEAYVFGSKEDLLKSL